MTSVCLDTLASEASIRGDYARHCRAQVNMILKSIFVFHVLQLYNDAFPAAEPDVNDQQGHADRAVDASAALRAATAAALSFSTPVPAPAPSTATAPVARALFLLRTKYQGYDGQLETSAYGFALGCGCYE